MQNSDEDNEASEKQRVKVSKLELENCSLYDSLGQLQVELQEARDALNQQSIQLEKQKMKLQRLCLKPIKLLKKKKSFKMN